ncbi:NADPH-dependent FMN reductase [Arvimicrobium flavum]|uniref:NADPH-dependent FMN reductase n=1 Tax=Arvimicrobium flavum TaxID=3393320 RepID=UPI00237BDE96|nr:NADPH-dependent FMN reductase [Mesorhizobium shangrilense]
MTLKLHTIICSTRPGRVGPKVAEWFNGVASAHGKFAPELVDLADFNLPAFDEPKHPAMQQYEHEHTKRWAASVASADAFAFVMPEYDFFPPATLVNAVQFVAREWHYKPAVIVSYGGISGGLRAAQAAKLLFTGVKMMPIPEGVPVPMVGQHVGEDGVFRPTDVIVGGARLALDELHKWTVALKPARAA